MMATQPYGTYTATVKVDDYCYSYNFASITFEVGPSTYAVSIQLSGVAQQYSANILVDGQNEGFVNGSQTTTLSFPIGRTHNITVAQYVAGGSGVRYYCAQNSLVVSSPGSYSFSYQTQFQLSVSTNPQGIVQVGNGGWFNAGASAQTGQAPQLVPGSPGVRYVFVNWVLDGIARNSTQISVSMTGPHNATAVYKTQYLLTVNSPNGLGGPQGGGYYNAGSAAQFSVTSPEGYLIQQVFVQWQGDYVGTSPQGSITMNGPKTVNAVWKTSYTNVYLAAAAVVVLLVIAVVFSIRRRRRPPPETKPTPAPESAPGASVIAAEVSKCQKCGAENPTGQKYCTDCGAQLTQS
jgi:ribosomal protein L40E